jgi:hypothetical protein
MKKVYQLSEKDLRAWLRMAHKFGHTDEDLHRASSACAMWIDLIIAHIEKPSRYWTHPLWCKWSKDVGEWKLKEDK